jgi:hypothetical protein
VVTLLGFAIIVLDTLMNAPADEMDPVDRTTVALLHQLTEQWMDYTTLTPTESHERALQRLGEAGLVETGGTMSFTQPGVATRLVVEGRWYGSTTETDLNAILAFVPEWFRGGALKARVAAHVKPRRARLTSMGVTAQSDIHSRERQHIVLRLLRAGASEPGRVLVDSQVIEREKEREEKQMPSIFLSHSSKDKFFVRRLAQDLQARGVRVWLDEAEINVGDSLTEKIGAAINEMDFVAVVLSHNSVGSNWVQKELEIALNKELAKRQVVVLPVLLEKVEMPPFLRDKKYADFSADDKFARGLADLLKALGLVSNTAESFVITEKVDVELVPRKPTKKNPVDQTPSERRLEGFEDIRIIGYDSSKTNQPNPEKDLYNVYLTLSADPPEEWIKIFEAERQFPRHNMWRRAWIEGGSIVVYCGLDEVKKYHLEDLKLDVQNSNGKFRKYLVETTQREQRQRAKENRERNAIDDLKNDLDFG